MGKHYKTIVLFGAGGYCVNFLEKNPDIPVSYVVDNDKNKIGSTIRGISIRQTCMLLNENTDSLLIIITSSFYEPIRKQLIGMGFIENIHFMRAEFLTRLCLEQVDFSIISEDCWGGLVYKKLGLRYNSPFIWIYIWKDDYFKMLENIRFYLNCKLTFVGTKWEPTLQTYYPIAKLHDIDLHFIHYVSESDAEEKWYTRLKRFNWENLIVKMAITNYEDAERFKQLNYKNKIAFTDRDYDIDCALVIDKSSIECKHDEAVRYHQLFQDLVRKEYSDYEDIAHLLNGEMK